MGTARTSMCRYSPSSRSRCPPDRAIVWPGPDQAARGRPVVGVDSFEPARALELVDVGGNSVQPGGRPDWPNAGVFPRSPRGLGQGPNRSSPGASPSARFVSVSQEMRRADDEAFFPERIRVVETHGHRAPSRHSPLPITGRRVVRTACSTSHTPSVGPLAKNRTPSCPRLGGVVQPETVGQPIDPTKRPRVLEIMGGTVSISVWSRLRYREDRHLRFLRR